MHEGIYTKSLPFGKISFHSEGYAYLILQENYQWGRVQAKALIAVVSEQGSLPYPLLIDHRPSISLDFEAQHILTGTDVFKCVGMIVNPGINFETVSGVIEAFRPSYPVGFFFDSGRAQKWVEAYAHGETPQATMPRGFANIG